MGLKMQKRVILTIVLCLLSVSGYANGLTKLKIMTYNVNGLPDIITKIKKYKSFESKKERLSNLCAFLKEKNANTESMIDAVMLQEVWLKKDQKILAQTSGYAYACYKDDKSFQSGLVILSNNPITNCHKNIFQDRTPDSGPGSIIDKKIKRAYLEATITLQNGQEFVLTNTHLISNYKPEPEDKPDNKFKFKPDSSESVRLSQLNEIFTDLASVDKPIIIGGDLNTGPEYPLWDKLSGDNGLAADHGYLFDNNNEATFSNTNIYVIKSEGSLDHFLANQYVEIKNSTVLSKETMKTVNSNILEVAQNGDSFKELTSEILEVAELLDNNLPETITLVDSSDHYAKIIDVEICCDPEKSIAAS